MLAAQNSRRVRPCAARALVCPYHDWTYDLAGALIHVPHAEAFAPGDCRDLPALPVVERHGLIWLGSDAAGLVELESAVRGFHTAIDGALRDQVR